jgi:hypothetical protein
MPVAGLVEAVERAIGLVGDLQGREIDTGVKAKWIIGGKTHDRRMRAIRFAGAVGEIERGAEVGHYIIYLARSLACHTSRRGRAANRAVKGA